MKLPKIEWPTALVLVAVIAAIVAVWITAPDHRGDILAALGTAGAVVLALMRALGGTPPPPPPAAPTSGGPSAPDDDSDDTQPPTSDGPPTRPRRVTMPPSTAARVGFDASEKRALDTSLKLLNAWNRETRRRIPRLAAMHRAGAIALVTMLLALAGCGSSALRTHSTIATIARVSVVTAGDAVALTCETALARCTDDACIERTGGDCRTAATAAEAAIAGVRAYVDVIEVAARADEGQIGEALDLALQAMARVYESVRETLAGLSLGVTLPPLPPVAVAIVRALVGGVTS